MSKTYDTSIPTKEKVFYGAGEIFGGGSATLISLILLVFFNKVLGIQAAVASTIIMVSKAWDAVSDPLMGVISDNTRSRWGRRRPYIIAGGVLTFIAMLLLFASISNASMTFKIVYCTFAYIFYCTASTVSQVPYCSMSSDISPDFKERNKANSVKLIFSMASACVCYIIPALVIEKLLNGSISTGVFYVVISIGFGLLFAVPLILSGIYTKERTPYESDKRAKFNLKNYLAPFKIKSFNRHIVMYICVFLCMDIISALAVYYATDVMRNAELFGMKMSSLFIIAPMMAMIICMLPVVLKLAKTKSKQYALRFGLPCYIIGGLFLVFMPPDFPGICVPIAAMIMGIGFSGAQSMPWMIFPDTVDVAELKTGKRDTGSFSGVMTFFRKMSTAIAIWIVGLVLTASGQILPEAGQEASAIVQPDSMLVAVRVMMGIAIALLIGITFITSFKYKVTDAKLTRVRYFLDKIKTAEPLSDTETMERENLVNELAGKNISKSEPQPVVNRAIQPTLDSDGYYSFTMKGDNAFRILQLTDIHYGAGILSGKADKSARNAIIRVVSEAKPDLIIITGDLVHPLPIHSGAINNKRMAKAIGELFDGFCVPWTFTFGNHDSEIIATLSKDKLAEYFMKFKYCIFTKGAEGITGIGNTLIKINNSDGKLVQVLVTMDSNMYITKSFYSGFDVIRDDQVEWYKSALSSLAKDGKLPDSLAFFHIPPSEFKEAWEIFTHGGGGVEYHFGQAGETNDYFGHSKKRKGKIFDAMAELGSTKGIFVGHDHLNNLSLTYKGIRMTYGLSVDYLAYKNIRKYSSQRGGTAVDILGEGEFTVNHIYLEELEREQALKEARSTAGEGINEQ